MKVRQYAYFALNSETVRPEEITARLGIEPDRVHVHRHPHRRGRHSWAIHGERADVRIDAQFASILARVSPVADGIAGLVGEGVEGVLTVFRDLAGTEEDDPEYHLSDGRMGFVIDTSVLEFLTTTGAHIWFDEYD